MTELLQTPMILLSMLLAAAYLIAAFRSNARPRPQPRRYNHRYARPPQRPQPPAQPRRDTRPQRERVMDLHARGAIFTVTDAPVIAGYDALPLGTVRVDAGPNHETRLRRAAAQRYPAANALVSLREVRETVSLPVGNGRGAKQIFKPREVHEWRATAVQAAPNLPELAPPARYRDDVVLIDGSNLMHWDVDAGRAAAPSLRPVAEVIAALKAKGVSAGVIFDATAGHTLEGRFLGHDALAARLPDAADVLVVDRGTQADWTLIQMAREEGLVIISNDHFRDAPSARHLLKQKGFVEGEAVRLLEPRA